MTDYDKFIEEQKENILKLLGDLIAVPSVLSDTKPGMPFGEENAVCLRRMLSVAERMGFKVNNRDNYYGTVDYFPENTSEIKLGILCHLDVVPAGNGWTFSPYKLTEKDGLLYGRGVTDDKGPAVSALFALYAVKQLGIKLHSGVRLIFGTNEENGSEDIAYYLKNDIMPPMVFTPDAEYPVINCEKGMVRTECSMDFTGDTISDLSGGHVINAVAYEAGCNVNGIDKTIIETAVQNLSNSCIFEISAENNTVKICCKGKSAHASTPSAGINAITGLFRLLNALPIKDCVQKNVIEKMCKLYPDGETDGKSLKMNMSDSSGELTHIISIVKSEGDKLTFKTDTRFPVCSSKKEIHRLMSESYSAAGIDIIEFTGSEPHYTDENSELIRALLQVYEERTGISGKCIAIGGGTYVHEIDGGVAFGIEHSGTDYHIHGADEFAPLSELLDNAAMFAQAIEKICC